VGQRFCYWNLISLAGGGTSLAAPLWAGLVALANQQAAANGQPQSASPIRRFTPLPKAPITMSCFHDITTGSNTNSASPNQILGGPAMTSARAWARPTAANLIPALLAPPADNLAGHAAAGLHGVRPGGGPFTVTGQTYTLKNTGLTPLNWSLVNTSVGSRFLPPPAV
jgi:hypothetical protein